MTAAMPSPKTTTSTKPNAGRPAAIEPSRISSALVDGIRPPARPRTKRLRQLSVEPAGGRWLWATPPWLCSRPWSWSAPWAWSWRLGRGRWSCGRACGAAARGRARASCRARGRGHALGAVVIAPRAAAGPHRGASSRRSTRSTPRRRPAPARMTTSGGRSPLRPDDHAPPARGSRACATRSPTAPGRRRGARCPRVPTR